MIPRWKITLLSLFYLLACTAWVGGVSVMSVDLGSEWMKVAIVSPGVPMEIALNKESQRKTPAFLSFRDGERLFGGDAQNVASKFPAKAYGYLLELLGKKVDSPAVQLFKERFSWHKIEADPERGTVVFRYDDDTTYSVEELVGQLLHKAKDFAEASAGQPVTDAVLIVPGFFNQAERQAMLNAGHLAGLKVLQLINDYTAVALNYGIFHSRNFNETAQYIMFYDMGASSTSATLVSYQVVRVKDRGVVETHPQATVLGVGFDRTLGGLEIQIRLQKFLAEKFTEMKKTKSDVYSNPRAMAKLFKEAGRLKNVLSANAEHFAQIEGLLDEEDFKVKVSRQELEDLCEDLFSRVGGPVQQALDNAGVTIDIVSHVILVGGGTRVPKVQEVLTSVVKSELGKNLNTDEAAVMGAAYKAADISTGFKVKKFITKDAVIFPIQVAYERELDGGEVKQQKRTLFGNMNSFPQKKMITFNKYNKDFEFLVHYGELDHLPKNEVELLGPKDLFRVSLKGVAEAVAKHSSPEADSKGIKAHFGMDESGVLSLNSVDYVVETVAGEEQSTLQKIGSGLSKLFGGSSKPTDEVETDTTPESDQSSDSEEKKDSDSPQQAEVKNTTEDATPDDSKLSGNETEKAVKKQKVIIKEEIVRVVEGLNVDGLSPAQLEVSLKKIELLNDHEIKKQRKEQARNQLESFVFDMLNKMELDQFQAASTNEEKDSINTACTQMSSWLDEEGFDAEAETYEEKLVQLNALTGPLLRRVREHEDRPEVEDALKKQIEAAVGFLKAIKEGNQKAQDSGEEAIFTPVELETLDKAINATKDWLKKMKADQKALALSASPVLTIHSIIDKSRALDREVNYLKNKLKIWRPTKKLNETKAETPKKSNSTQTKKLNETLKDEGVTLSDLPLDNSVNEEQKETVTDKNTETSENITPESSETEEPHQEL